MPISSEIDPEARRIRTTARGEIKGPDLVDYYRRLRSTPGFRSDYDELFDLTAARALDVTAEDVRRFSEVTERFTSEGPPVRVAIVAVGDVEFGLSRMYGLMQGRSVNDIRVFRSLEEAEAWLGEPGGPPPTA